MQTQGDARASTNDYTSRRRAPLECQHAEAPLLTAPTNTRQGTAPDKDACCSNSPPAFPAVLRGYNAIVFHRAIDQQRQCRARARLAAARTAPVRLAALLGAARHPAENMAAAAAAAPAGRGALAQAASQNALAGSLSLSLGPLCPCSCSTPRQPCRQQRPAHLPPFRNKGLLSGPASRAPCSAALGPQHRPTPAAGSSAAWGARGWRWRCPSWSGWIGTAGCCS
jgi:hypothetical protein